MRSLLASTLLLFALAGAACADPRAESARSVEAERGFDELVLSVELLSVGAESASGPTRRVFRLRSDGRMLLERTHPVLQFPTCRGRATEVEVDRVRRLLPSSLPSRIGPEVERSDVEGRVAFRLARKRADAVDATTGLLQSLEGERELTELVARLDMLARKLVNLQGESGVRLEGRVVVRPLDGRYEVLIQGKEGEVVVAQPLASVLRPLNGYPARVEGVLGEDGALARGRVLEPLPVRAYGKAMRLGKKPVLLIAGGPTLHPIGVRRHVVSAARGHRVEVSGWRYENGRLLIDSVGALADVPTEAKRREATVAAHEQGAGLRVIQVSLEKGALVQASSGGRIGWVPLGAIRWSPDAQLPPPEGAGGACGAVGKR